MKKNFDLLLNIYFENGYARLGKICSNSELLKLNKRVKDLMSGNIEYKNMFFQLDSKDGILNKGHLVNVNSKFLKKRPIEHIALKKGEAIIFDNHLVHKSDKNRTKKNRLAFTACMLDANAIHLKTKKRYPKIFGRGSINYKTIKNIKKTRIIPRKVYH